VSARLFAFLLGAAVYFVPARAEADVRVERAPGAEECPTPSAFAERLRASSATRDVSVRFTKTHAGFASTVRTAEGATRSIEDPTCDALANATLVVVRLALDVPAPPASEDPPPPPPPTVVPQERPVAPGRSAGIEILAGAATTIGIGSPLAPGARVTGSLYFGHWGVGVTGLVLATQTRSLERGEVDVGVLGGGIEGCGRIGEGSLRGALCSRFELLRLAGAARGFARNEEQARPLGTFGLLVRGQARIAPPVGLFAEAGVTVPSSRERFEIEGAGLVYDAPILAAAGAFGAYANFE
jgi:hypothetical protein